MKSEVERKIKDKMLEDASDTYQLVSDNPELFELRKMHKKDYIFFGLMGLLCLITGYIIFVINPLGAGI